MDENLKLVEYALSQLTTQDEMEICLALLQKRMCQIVPLNYCINCIWKGSILCLPIRRHLEKYAGFCKYRQESKED